ncbi:MAG: protein kinase [Pseudomonadales bacterium]|nr:protein kinase [Pseudomonadales bacterium]
MTLKNRDTSSQSALVLPSSNNETRVIKTRIIETQVSKARSSISLPKSLSDVEVVRTGVSESKRGFNLEVGSIVKGRFELVALIGSGGMGVVYKAKDRRQEEAGDDSPYIALKVLNPQLRDDTKFLRALQQETKKTQLLSHPNIVNVYDFDRDDDVVFMTMELLEGSSLDQLHRDHALPNTQKEQFHIIQGMIHALEYAHANGIVHADLKPSNVFIDQAGSAKIVDFGIARTIGDSAVTNDNDEVSAVDDIVALTPLYASVNMLAGGSPKVEDDYYALGCVIYSVLEQRHPYSRYSASEVFDKGLSPKRIEILSRRQWQGLLGLIDVNRDPSGALKKMKSAFSVSSISRRKFYCMALVLVMPLLLFVLYQSSVWLHNRSALVVLDTFVTDANASSAELLDVINAFSSERKKFVINKMRKPLMTYFEAEIRNLSDSRSPEYDLILAFQLSSKLESIFIDSAYLNRMKKDLFVIQDSVLQQLENQYKEVTSNQLYWNPKGEWDIAQVVSLARRTKLEVHFINESQVRQGYIRYVRTKLFYQDLREARAALAKALVLYPEDIQLKQLQVKATIKNELVEREGISVIGIPVLDSLDDIDKKIQLSFAQHFNGNSKINESIVNFMSDVKDIDIHEYAARKNGMEYLLSETLSRSSVQLQNRRVSTLELARQLMPHRYETFDPKPVRKENCPRTLAGKGRDALFRCQDRISRNHLAPLMVVIPAKKTFESFAITQAEISEKQFAIYCRSRSRSDRFDDTHSVCVAPNTATNLPMTNVSMNQIQAYIAWLSKVTAESYRLPTSDEWTRAAAMSDLTGLKDYNCHVRKEGKVIRGVTVRSSKEGLQDAHGLINMIGNVAEVVRGEGGLWVRGGSYLTPFNFCGSHIKQYFDGSATKNVGFRLLRLIEN